MAKKKNKQASNHPFDLIHQSTHCVFEKVLRPWCWYCEREFEDEKGLSGSLYRCHRRTNPCLDFSLDAAPKGQTF